MTIDIKALAKQAGGTTHTTMGDRLTIFLPDALAEFVRLVRERALDEAVTLCNDFIEEYGQASYRLGKFNHECQGHHAGMTYADAIRELK